MQFNPDQPLTSLFATIIPDENNPKVKLKSNYQVLSNTMNIHTETQFEIKICEIKNGKKYFLV